MRYLGENRRRIIQQGSSESMATNGLAINGERHNVDAKNAIGSESDNDTSGKNSTQEEKPSILEYVTFEQ